jgi:pimeloyl-ACP methyl ester carboxylesterase
MNDFVVSARRPKQGVFAAEPGPSHMLLVPAAAPESLPSHGRMGELWVKAWLQQLLAEAIWGTDERTGAQRGDILVYVHGYNNSAVEVLKRHRRLKADLKALGWKGVLVSFDWPSDNKTAGYLEDRHDAKITAMQLVTDLIARLAAKQTPDCAVNTHIIAHSMGTFVVREAFDDADDAKLENNCWMVSQLCLIGADISAASLAEGHACRPRRYAGSSTAARGGYRLQRLSPGIARQPGPASDGSTPGLSRQPGSLLVYRQQGLHPGPVRNAQGRSGPQHYCQPQPDRRLATL